MDPSATPSSSQFSMPLPRGFGTRIHVHLTVQARSVLLFLTTVSADDGSSLAPLGSFVYAIPDRFDAAQPLSTPLLADEPTVDLATRAARLLARKTQMPVYVASSMSFASTVMGGSVEEEMEAFRQVMVEVVERIQAGRDQAGKEEAGKARAPTRGAELASGMAG